jgi:hypothetical protein
MLLIKKFTIVILITIGRTRRDRDGIEISTVVYNKSGLLNLAGSFESEGELCESEPVGRNVLFSITIHNG